MSFSGSQITRQGLSGTPRGLYGSFAGRAVAVVLIDVNRKKYVSESRGIGITEVRGLDVGHELRDIAIPQEIRRLTIEEFSEC